MLSWKMDVAMHLKMKGPQLTINPNKNKKKKKKNWNSRRYPLPLNYIDEMVRDVAVPRVPLRDALRDLTVILAEYLDRTTKLFYNNSSKKLERSANTKS